MHQTSDSNTIYIKSNNHMSSSSHCHDSPMSESDYMDEGSRDQFHHHINNNTYNSTGDYNLKSIPINKGHTPSSASYMDMYIYVYPLPYYFETTPSIDEFCDQHVSTQLHDHKHSNSSKHHPTKIILCFPIAISSFDAQISSIIDADICIDGSSSSMDCDRYQHTCVQGYYRSIYSACQRYTMTGILFPVSA